MLDGKETWDSFDLMFERQIMHNNQYLKELRLRSGDQLQLFSSNTESFDLQLSSEPRAAAVKAESLRLMEQLQNSLRDM